MARREKRVGRRQQLEWMQDALRGAIYRDKTGATIRDREGLMRARISAANAVLRLAKAVDGFDAAGSLRDCLIEDRTASSSLGEAVGCIDCGAEASSTLSSARNCAAVSSKRV